MSSFLLIMYWDHFVPCMGVVIHWSILDLSGATLLKKTMSLPSSNHQHSIGPQLGVGAHNLTILPPPNTHIFCWNIDWLGLVRAAITAVVSCHDQKTLSCLCILWSLAFKIFLSFFHNVLWSLWGRTVSDMVGYYGWVLIDSDFLHFL